jgi:hypothetical protein
MCEAFTLYASANIVFTYRVFLGNDFERAIFLRVHLRIVGIGGGVHEQRGALWQRPDQGLHAAFKRFTIQVTHVHKNHVFQKDIAQVLPELVDGSDNELAYGRHSDRRRDGLSTQLRQSLDRQQHDVQHLSSLDIMKLSFAAVVLAMVAETLCDVRKVLRNAFQIMVPHTCPFPFLLYYST